MMQLKFFKQKIKFNKKTLAVAVFILICTLLLISISAIRSSVPGDFLYTLNSIFFSNAVAKENTDILETYVKSINQHSNGSNCVQLLLLEDEVASRIKYIFEQSYSNIQELLEVTLLIDTSENQSCAISPDLLNISFVIESFIGVTDSTAVETVKNSLKTEYVNAQLIIRESAFDSQQKINTVTQLLLHVRDSIASETVDPFKIFYAKFVMDNLDDFINSDMGIFTKYENLIYSICLLKDAEICKEQNIITNINSVNNSLNEQSQVVGGYNLVRSYFDLLIPLVNNEN